MKRFLLLVALLLSASSAFAEWKLLRSDSERQIYVESSRIRKEGNSVKVWALTSHNAPIPKADIFFQSAVILYQLDCQNERIRVFSSVFYSGPMGKGDTVHSSNEPKDWMNAIPGTLGDIFVQKYCQRNN